MTRRDLVTGDGILKALPRSPETVRPGEVGHGPGVRFARVLVPEIADNGEIIAMALQRFHAGRQLEVATRFLDEELLGEAVAEAEKDEPLRRLAGGLRKSLPDPENREPPRHGRH